MRESIEVTNINKDMELKIYDSDEMTLELNEPAKEEGADAEKLLGDIKDSLPDWIINPFRS